MTKPRNKESVWSCREEESASKSYTFQNKFLSVRIVELGIWCCTFNFKNPSDCALKVPGGHTWVTNFSFQ